MEQGFRYEKGCLSKKKREQLVSVMEILERIRPAVPSAVARGYGGTKSHGEAGAIQRGKRLAFSSQHHPTAYNSQLTTEAFGCFSIIYQIFYMLLNQLFHILLILYTSVNTETR